MTAITIKSASTSDAIVSLLRSDSTSNAAASTSTDAVSSSKRDETPAAVVDLSDRAKALLERNKTDQIVADRLQTLVQGLKDPNSDQSGKSSGRVNSVSVDPKDLNGYLASLFDANKRPDGTYENFSKSVEDVFDVPSTPEEVDAWYQRETQAVTVGLQDFTDADYQSYAQAVLNRTVTFHSAKDIPGLNFHNTITFQGGDGGGSAGYQDSYNLDAAILKDPATAYAISSTGTVASWKKPQPST